MIQSDITRLRLENQHLSGEGFEDPVEVVEWMGAIQAQDYERAKWTVGMRTQAATEAQIEQDLTDGKILRTHLLRPTWHFVSARDIRWLLALTGPRVGAVSAGRHRQLGLDEGLFKRSQAIMGKVLAGGKHLTRQEIQVALESEKIEAKSSRLAHIMMRAELDGVVCSGARRGKQFTYALVEERVPPAPPLTRDEALMELVKRYFGSHGPATEHDFARWSNLTLSDTQWGIDMVGSVLEKDEVDGTTYYFVPSESVVALRSPIAHLLSPYDDFTVGYKDHAMNRDPVTQQPIKNAVYPMVVTIDGEIVGTWQSSEHGGEVMVSVTRVRSFSEAELEAIEVAAGRYGEYRGMDVRLEQM